MDWNSSMARYQVGIVYFLWCLFIIGCAGPKEVIPSNLIREAIAQKKMIFAVISAEWCGPCKSLKRDCQLDEKLKVQNPQQGPLKDFIVYIVDGDKERWIVDRLQVQGYPTYFLIDSNGKILKRQTGYRNINDIINFLRQ